MADVVLRGYSGYNTRWALRAASKVFDGMPPDGVVALTVFFGANDASLPERSSAPQHVPLEEYSRNLKAIVNFIKERWPAPPINEDGRLRYPYGDNSCGLPERTNESAGAYAKACISVAAEYGLPVVDLYSKMQQIPGWEKALLRLLGPWEFRPLDIFTLRTSSRNRQWLYHSQDLTTWIHLILS